jgi:thiamine-phosphate pyrophosphorylase
MNRSERRGRIRGLYAVTPERPVDADLLARVDAALAAGVAVLQYRDKSGERAARRHGAAALRDLCARHGALFVVNDDAALAAEVEADGVHVGREDGGVAAARDAVGPDRLVGVSCYASLALAREAAAQGADYVAFGSVFPSRTKPHAPPAPLELFAVARRELALPCVAIGGIDAGNLARVAAAGADAAAIVSAVFDPVDTGSAVRALRAAFVGGSAV